MSEQRTGRSGVSGTAMTAAAALLLALVPGGLWAQQQPGGVPAVPQQGDTPPPATPAPGNISEKPAEQPGQPQPSAARTGAESENSPASKAVEGATQPVVEHPGVLLDRVLAVVNGEVILDSDVALEQRLSEFQPVTDPAGTVSESKALNRLINRALLLQQAKLQPHKAVTDQDIADQIGMLRKDIPACKEYRCDTDAGWAKFESDHQVTPEELDRYLRRRLDALAFIELRFRSGIRISHTQIKDYYEQTMLPEYKKRGVKPPTLENLEPRIQEVLLQQQVSGLLRDWLQSLRAQGTVQIVEGSPATL